MTILQNYVETDWSVAVANNKATPFFDVKLGDYTIGLYAGEDNYGFPYFNGIFTPSFPVQFSTGYLTPGTPVVSMGVGDGRWIGDASVYMSVTGTTGYRWGGAAVNFRGAIGGGATSNAQTTGTPSIALTTTVDDGAILVVIVDKVGVSGASRAWLTVNGHAPTELRYFTDGQSTVYIALYESTGSAGSKTVGLSTPAGQTYAIMAQEIKPRTVTTKTVSWDAALVPKIGLAVYSPASYGLVNSANISVGWIYNDTQVKYRAKIYSDAEGITAVYDSGLVTSGVQAATLATGAALTSNTVYYLQVYAENGSTSLGLSALVPFYFALPTATNITGLTALAFPACAPTPFDNPSIVLNWTRPAPVETFLAYEVRRRKRGETDYVPIARILGITNNSYVDANVQPGQEYEYVVVFYGDNSTPKTLVSANQTTPVRATLRFDWIYIHEVEDSQTEFFRVDSLEGSQEVQQDIVVASTWGRQAPTAFVGEQFSHKLSLSGLEKLRRHPAEWARFTRMRERQSTAGTLLCVRLGLDRELYFVSMLNLSKGLTEQTWTESVELQEVAYEESVGYYEHTAGGSP